MIFVNRKRRDNTDRMIEPSESWFDKARAATDRAIEEKQDHLFDDRIYADDREVTPALEELFYEKCAYCEKPLPEVWDVEHFRPKRRVAEEKGHPGYYWLAYSWENLYPSCLNCNRRRKDKPTWEDLSVGATGGKFDQFPLFDEDTRAMSPADDFRREHTLLIDPCYDDPQDYFGYDPKGGILALESNPYAEKTIEVCHLQRRRLRRERAKVISCAVPVLRLIRKAKQKKNVQVVKALQEFLNNTIIGDDCYYAGVARFTRDNPDVFV